jgi:hypothetical protein
MDQGARKRLGRIQALLLMALSEMKRHVHNIERIPGGAERWPRGQYNSSASARAKDLQLSPTRLQDPLKQLRKAQVPKLHSHLAVLAPLFPEGFSTCPDRHLRNVDEERESGPFATR